MLDLLIDRRWKKEKYTIGRLFANGTFLCNTLEDTDRGLTSTMSLQLIRMTKISGMTAIPRGTYKVVLSVSEKFKKKAWSKKYGGLVPEIVGVPGFTGVRIHPGNSDVDSEGCPLVGDNTVIGKLTNSVNRYYELMDKYLMPAWNAGETIELTIQ